MKMSDREWAVANAIYDANRQPLPGAGGARLDNFPPTLAHASKAVTEFVWRQAKAAIAVIETENPE